MNKAKCVKIRTAGGPEVLSIADIDVRDPGHGEILVEVAAAGLNRADLLQRRGMYPAPKGALPDVPGLEYAGHVAAIGSGVTAYRPGDAVMGIIGGGGMATRVVVHEREAMPVPAGMDAVTAAAIPEVFSTAYDALFVQGGMALGEHVVIHSVASGVGTAAIQLVNMAGARAFGTSRTPEKLTRCRDIGAVDGIVATDGRFADEVLRLTASAPADAADTADVRGAPSGAQLILDTVGGSYLAENLRALAPRGRLVLIGLMGGPMSQANLALLLTKRLTVVGSVLRSRSLEEKAALAQLMATRVVPHFTTGALKPVIGEILPMNDISDAHARMEQNDTFGKIVMRW